MNRVRSDIGYTLVMKIDILSTILTCLALPLVQGLGPDLLSKNGSVDTSRRVISGELADPNSLKFLVRLESGPEFCGGSVIGNYFVLTAAHCLVHTECERIKIYPSNWVPGTTSRIRVVQCFSHEKFNYAVHFYYDMALIKTFNDMLQDGDFTAIPLPQPGARYPVGTPAVVSGWGKNIDRIYPNRLFSGKVILQDWDSCNSAYTNRHALPDKPRRAICTRGPPDSPTTASCQGDSGGPVVINNVLAGIIVGTLLTPEGECLIGTPSLHLNVADFLPWIYHFVDPGRDTSNYPVIDEPF